MRNGDFDPTEWMDWMLRLWNSVKLGGVWASTEPTPCVLRKTRGGWAIIDGEPHWTAREVIAVSGLSLEETP